MNKQTQESVLRPWQKHEFVKKLLCPNLNSLDKLRGALREQLRNRSQALRRKKHSEYRHSSEEALLPEQYLAELRQLLKNAPELEQETEADKLSYIEQIEMELMSFIVEENERIQIEELQYMVQNLSNSCIYCWVQLTEGQICEHCYQLNIDS